MKKQFTNCFILLLSLYVNSGTVNAQTKTITVFGYIEDSLSGEKLVNVTIKAQTPDKIFTSAANSYGFFTISLPGSKMEIEVSCIGYEPKKLLYEGTAKQETIIKLLPEIKMEDEVIITSNENRIATNSLGQLKLSSGLIKKMPKFLGDNDPLKVMQTLPGISQGMEGTTGLIVRGGSPDQNLFLLDGTPVYNPTHLGGVFSPFNGDAIKDITLYKGNFPARFGERLSSVIDLTTKDGNMKKLAGEGSVGMLASKVLFEGPIKKDQSSFMISARRTYWDLLASPLIAITNNPNEKRKMNLNFYDINAKFNYILSAKDRLYASFFASNDQYKFKTYSNYNNGYTENNVAQMGWQNLAGSLRWNHLFSPQLFSNTTIYATNYKLGTGFNNNATDNGTNTINEGMYNSHIKDIGIKTDLEYKTGNLHSLRFGIQGSYKYFQPGISSRHTVTDGNTVFNNTTVNGKQASPEIAVYAEDELRFSENLNANVGLRASTFKAGKTWYKSLEPRISLNYYPVNNLRVSGAYSQMRQYIHLLANNSVSLPTDIWVPATDKIKPVFSRQFSLGLNSTLADNDLDLGFEAYYKKLNGVVEYKDGEGYLSTSAKNWQDVVETGTGRAYGVELFLQKKFGKSTGWAGYSFSRSMREFPTINDGKDFPFKYDRRHVFNLVYMYQIGKHWKFSANWTFQSGSPFTLPTSTYQTAGGFGPDNNNNYLNPPAEYISGRNAFRLLDYHRLDIGFTWSKKKKNFEKYWDFSFYNIYNRKNPMLYNFETNVFTGKPALKGTGFLPLIPSISYGFKF
ncbi:hypothetical protein BAY13_17250 [Elizabethkingia bruuniana]|uniref:TonB-dependent receptor n=1 Tax=Elizabethkingia bruuniana TaxID=1756149 RepID=UPI00099AF3C8|nr:TonB-dependent receptor [Elizabethkingia bruuniana]OPC66479.1 hypothetical protein BAY13_17250 [Elizabethkingia bruuniana]